jgi:homocysteine S-methyltransferase
MVVGTGDPVTPFLERQDVMILDGGLATELEARGCDLRDALWSAKVLIEDAGLLQRVHADYLAAGADCIASASYQASFEGFRRRGLSEDEAAELLRLSVRLAVEVRDAFWSDPANRSGRLQPLVAASVGPYGAALADGSEYTGSYHLDAAGLRAFHRQRWHVLATSGADLLACETIPSHVEARVLLELLRETPDSYAWFSFSCRDGKRVSDGTSLAETLAPFNDVPQVVAVGVNCTAPSLIPNLISEARHAVDQPIVVYPNSGEGWDAATKCWIGTAEAVVFATASEQWRDAGASIIGGCCRTGPQHIREIRGRLIGR